MIALALRSLRSRRTSLASTLLSVVLASLLIGSFATLAQSSFQSGISDGDQQALLTMGIVVGGWGALIALFSLTSTLGIAIRQRDVEIGLLRTIGTTPRQARRMLRTETFVLAVLGAVVGAALAWPAGAGLLALLRASDAVSGSVDYAGGAASLGAVVVALVLVSLVAATVAGRRTTSGPARLAIAEGNSGMGAVPRWRVVVGLLLIAYAVVNGVLTMTVMKSSDDPYAAMQTAGSAAIVASVGLAALASVLLRWAALVVRPLMRLGGASGQLASSTAARRPGLLAGVLGAVTVFVATTTGVLMMVGIDGRRLAAIAPDAQERQTVTLLNDVVTGMIAIFAAIMLLNALVAVTAQRHEELRRLHLVGATPRQVRSTVLAEAGLVAGVGIGLGLLAACVTVIPYSVARGEGVVPDGQLWLPGVVALVAAVLTIGGQAFAVRRVPTGSRR